MQKIIILLILVSIGFAETNKERNYRILSNSKNIYMMNFKTGKCNLHETSFLKGFKTGSVFFIRKLRNFDSGAILLNKSLAENNGRYVFFGGIGAVYFLYMPNNKEFCEKIVNAESGEAIKKLIAKAVSVPITFTPDFTRKY